MHASILSNFMTVICEFDSQVDWLTTKNVLQRGYQGRGSDGNNPNKVLKNLYELN